jgi:hypothetical protein
MFDFIQQFYFSNERDIIVGGFFYSFIWHNKLSIF